MGMSLHLRVMRDDSGRFVAWDEDYITHGSGKTVREAVDDYLSGLEELWASLKEDWERLAPHLVLQLAYIDRLFDPPEGWIEGSGA